MPAKPEEFLTVASISTFAGASGAVWCVTATIQKLWGKTSVWIPFTVSVVIGLVVAWKTLGLQDPLEWIVAIVNCCMLFASATGLNESAAAALDARAGSALRAQTARKRFVESWLRK
jgi:hypothetical protein